VQDGDLLGAAPDMADTEVARLSADPNFQHPCKLLALDRAGIERATSLV
jgi:hypothetical protein